MGMGLLPVVVGPALIVGAAYGVTVIGPASVSHDGPARAYSRDGDAGRSVYAANGCVTCHSLQRRDVFADAGLGPAVSTATEDAGDRPAMHGQARYGPDLSCVGSRVPGAGDEAGGEAKVEAMVAYLEEPASVHAGSTMPSYRFLSNDDLRRVATYLVEHTCGGAE